MQLKNVKSRVLSILKNPTDPFTTLELSNPSNDALELKQNSPLSRFWGEKKIWKGRSGSYFFNLFPFFLEVDFQKDDRNIMGL